MGQRANGINVIPVAARYPAAFKVRHWRLAGFRVKPRMTRLIVFSPESIRGAVYILDLCASPRVGFFSNPESGMEKI